MRKTPLRRVTSVKYLISKGLLIFKEMIAPVQKQYNFHLVESSSYTLTAIYRVTGGTVINWHIWNVTGYHWFICSSVKYVEDRITYFSLPRLRKRDVIKIYSTLERRKILHQEHIFFITVIYYLYAVYVIAALRPSYSMMHRLLVSQT